MADNVVKIYEKKFADYFQAKKAFAFWKARVAFYAILKAMGIGEGDKVIMPGFTCVANVNPVKYAGAKPVYIDIEPKTFNMDVNLLEKKISPRTKLIVVQHTFGYPCDIDSIRQIADRNGIPFVEDCCLSPGSKYRDKKVGKFGKAAYFSFQWNKFYTSGLGGMVVTDDLELAGKIDSIRANEACCPSTKEILMLAAQLAVYRTFIYPRTTAFAQNLFRYLTRHGLVVGSFEMAELEPKMSTDFFKVMSNMQARSGLRQLEKIDENIAHRREIAALYDKLLTEKGWTARAYNKSMMEPVMVRYPIRITQKDKAIEKASVAGVELGAWFESPLHPKETPLHLYDYETGMCPEAEKACREVVNLPLHPRVTEKTARKTVDFITKFTEAR